MEIIRLRFVEAHLWSKAFKSNLTADKVDKDRELDIL